MALTKLYSDLFTVTDAKGKEVVVTVENKRVSFEPLFDVTADGHGYVSYIEMDFKMHYAPDVAQSADQVWEYFPSDKKGHLATILKNAKYCVQDWDIRDEVDARHQKTVLSICEKHSI